MIQTPGSGGARPAARQDLTTLAADEFPGVDIFVKILEIGPPVGRPVQYRVSGPDIDALRDAARELAALRRDRCAD